MKNITLAITGASGIDYSFRLLEVLLKASCHVSLVISPAAFIVAEQESDWHLPGNPQRLKAVLLKKFQAAPEYLSVYGYQDWNAPIASGSYHVDAMVVCPCTSGCLAAIASGMSDNLLERAADVVLKEQHKLILVHRETPLSAIHLENMLKLARMGAVMLPANPGFYQHPKTIQDLIDFVVARILDQLGVKQELLKPWGSNS